MFAPLLTKMCFAGIPGWGGICGIYQVLLCDVPIIVLTARNFRE
jgi:hypothetical protein